MDIDNGRRYACTQDNDCGEGWACIDEVCAPACSVDAGGVPGLDAAIGDGGSPDAGSLDGGSPDATSLGDGGSVPDASIHCDMDAGLVDAGILSRGVLSLLAGAPGGMGHSDDPPPGSNGGTFVNPVGLAYDPAGNLYVSDGNAVRQIMLATRAMVTVAGSSKPGCSDGVGAAAAFDHPTGLAYDGAGNVFVADTNNNLIREIVAASHQVSTLAGSGAPGSADGMGTLATFNSPGWLAYGGGILYVSDANGKLIREIDVTNGATVSTLTTAELNPPVAGLAYNSTGFLYGVAQTAVLKIDTSSGTTTPFASGPGGWLAATYDPTSQSLYVTNSGGDQVDLVSMAGAVTAFAGSLGNASSNDGIGTSATFDNPTGIAIDAKGNLLVAEFAGYAIRSIELNSGLVTTVQGGSHVQGTSDSSGVASRFQHPSKTAVDISGNLYVADSANDTIRQLNLSTGVVLTLAGLAGVAGFADGPLQRSTFSNPSGLAYDFMHSELYVADTANDTIRIIDLTGLTVSTVAGNATFAGSLDGKGSAAGFTEPQGIALDPTFSILYVADTGNDTIRAVDVSSCPAKPADCGTVSTVAGSPGITGAMNGTGSTAQFNSPQGIVVAGGGELYVADAMNNAIRVVVPGPDGGAVTTLTSGDPVFTPTDVATDGTNVFVANSADADILQVSIASGQPTVFTGVAGQAGNRDGTAAEALFFAPYGLAYDGNSALLYVVDSFNNNAREIAIGSTSIVTTVGGLAPTQGSANGIGYSALLAGPGGLAFDPGGTLYVADWPSHGIRQINVASGAVTTLIGDPSNAACSTSNGWFNIPTGLALDAANGNLHVTDQVCGAVMVHLSSLQVSQLWTINGSGATPQGAAVDPAGNLYVADSSRNVVCVIKWMNPCGCATIAGSGIAAEADGNGTGASFNGPFGLALDGNGNLYVSDMNGNTIRRITLGSTNQVKTVAGMPQAGSSDGLGILASFNGPAGLAYDGVGNLYVADQGNSTVRRIDLSTSQVTTVVGVAGQKGLALGPLRGGLNAPDGIAVAPGLALFVSDPAERAILQAR
jgi:mucin-19